MVISHYIYESKMGYRGSKSKYNFMPNPSVAFAFAVAFAQWVIDKRAVAYARWS